MSSARWTADWIEIDCSRPLRLQGGPEILSLRDSQLAALIHGLEDQREDFTAVGVALQEALGRDADPDAIDRSEILRPAIRVGLREVAPEVIETRG